MPKNNGRKDTLEQRYWPKVKVAGEDECWLWQANTNPDGYGTIGCEETSVKAHRIAWELEYGPIPEGMNVCHHCDNPPCCNPRHLFLGTQKDNVYDMMAKGRTTALLPQLGIKHPRAVLTEEQAREIKYSGLPKQELAKKYGRCAVHNIQAGNTWKHITRDPPESETENE